MAGTGSRKVGGRIMPFTIGATVGVFLESFS